MIWVRITSVLFCLVGLAFVLAPSAGELRPTAGVVKGSSTISQPESAILDSIYSDDPFVKRVRDTSSDGSFRQTVPMVELDTVVHEKKLWLAEKKLVSPPVYSRYGRITAMDTLIYVSFATRYGGTSYMNSVYSLNSGFNWSVPEEIQCTNYNTKSSLLLKWNQVFLAYSASWPNQYWLEEELLRKATTEDFILSDSLIINTMSGYSSRSTYYPDLLDLDDTLYVAYGYHDFNLGINSLNFKKSADQGETWSGFGDSVYNVEGPKFFLLTDTIFSVVGSFNLNVWFGSSFDRGITWSEVTNISDNGYSSQLPNACSDGDSGIYVAWYDFENGAGSNGWSGTVFYRFSHNFGNHWSEIRALSPGPYAENVELAADTMRVYAIWNDDRYNSPDLALYLRYSLDRGQTWSPEYKVVSEVDPAWDPQVYVDGDQFHMIWREQHPPDWLWGIWYIHGIWYVPGDADNSGGVDVSDLSYIVDYLFRGGEPSWVPDAAQINGTEGVDVSDLTYFVDYLFGGGDPPVGGEPGL